MASTVVEIGVAPGAAFEAGALLAVVEAMKMEHELRAAGAGRVLRVDARPGDALEEGDTLLVWEPLGAAHRDATGTPRGLDARAPAHAGAARSSSSGVGADELRPELAELHARLALVDDAARPDAVAKRHALGLRTARENVEALCDPGSFIEYGALAIAAQTSRRGLDDLQRNTPADGMVTGIGGVNATLHGQAASRCVVLAYDATVLAGTQGFRNHQKTDRMLGIALEQRLPVVLFGEGGGGRPGDTDMPIVAGLHVPTFASFARLSGRVPVVAIVAGRCFAGNAALVGCCDVLIATRGSNIGMGGPAMVEGGGLGVHPPEAIGPSDVQSANGVIDVLVDDERQAVSVARRYLSYFQGDVPVVEDDPVAPRPALRDALPTNRVRVYDMRAVMALIADADSMLELRAGFGLGIHTALARIGGTAIGLLASNPTHLGGAIDADAADKAARFMQLCDAHGLPLVALVDTPGFMVGPEIETRAQVRHVSRMFVVGARRRVPFLAVVVRKGYGLGAMAMTGGGFHATTATVAWPSGEFGAMGLEGAVRLGYRKELAAQPEGAAREALFEALLARQVENGKALNMAATLEIDAVIDPAETRAWLARALASARVGPPVDRFVDPW
jgi:acetyl-CoA carboxylase carboxyltransferase component